MLTTLKLRDFRCFASLECEFAPGTTAIVGPNAQGKTSLLEAACVLLRLQSPRVPSLASLVRLGGIGFVLDGFFSGTHLQVYFSPRRKKLALDSVEQRTPAQYLEVGRVVWFSNSDIAIVRGPAEERRRYLDFLASQSNPAYRKHLRAYERALRARNRLLKAPSIRWREISAFDEPLIAAGNALTAARAALVAGIQAHAAAAQQAISEARETLAAAYAPASGADFAETLAASREADARLRQTTVGPHRDELTLTIDGLGIDLASEGQQRTVALALRAAQARLLAAEHPPAPLLLLDDIFGELDPRRRNALLDHLPRDSQRILTTTHLDWSDSPPDRVFLLRDRLLTIQHP